jgi:hypothetical protein
LLLSLFLSIYSNSFIMTFTFYLFPAFFPLFEYCKKNCFPFFISSNFFLLSLQIRKF